MMLLFLVSLAAAACSATELKVAPGYDILHTLDLQNVSRVRLQPGVHTVSRPWKLGGDIKNLLILGEGGATISGGLPVTRWSRAELGLASSPPMRFSAPYMDDDSINQKRPSTTSVLWRAPLPVGFEASELGNRLQMWRGSTRLTLARSPTLQYVHASTTNITFKGSDIRPDHRST